MKKEEILNVDLQSQENFEKKYFFLSNPEETDELCPICESPVYRNGRCKTCFECGWSSCEI